MRFAKGPLVLFAILFGTFSLILFPLRHEDVSIAQLIWWIACAAGVTTVGSVVIQRVNKASARKRDGGNDAGTGSR